MKRNKFAAALLSAIGMLALLASGLAAPPEDILTAVGPFKPTLNFRDSYGEKVLTIPAPPAEPGEPRDPPTHEQVVKPQKISAKIVANIEGFDFAELDDDLAVGLVVGGFEFGSTLGESREAVKNGGTFPAGGKKAKFLFIGSFEKPNGEIVERKVGSLIFSWTLERLTVTLSVTNLEAAEQPEIGASAYTGLYEDQSPLGNKPSGSVKFADEPIEVSVTFGSANGTQTARAKGTSKTTYKTFGSDAAGTLEEFFLQSATLIGKADPNAAATP